MSSGGKTARMHARRILEKMRDDAGGGFIHEAKKRVVPVRGGWRNLGEDIFGLFDFILVAPPNPTYFVQVTTDTGGGVSTRRKKILASVKREFGKRPSREVIQLWSLVPRAGYLRCWSLLPPEHKLDWRWSSERPHIPIVPAPRRSTQRSGRGR